MKSKFLKVGLPIGILVVSIFIMMTMIYSRPAPKKEIKEFQGPLVQIVSAKAERYQIYVNATGTVHSRMEANIAPQVSGRITAVSSSFVAGGFFKKGELLFQIEKIDYQLNVDRARAALAEAELQLAREESNARIARMEWENLSEGTSEKPHPLVVYEPQLKRAQANVDSAHAALRQAELDLARTSVRAPFNCRIRSETIDIGQYVRAGDTAGVIAGTDEAEIIIPLSLVELQWLRIPRHGSKKKGSPATIKIKSGTTYHTWEGKVIRSLGEVDEKGRMGRIVVAVKDPYRFKEHRVNGEPDLEVGMFVEVTILGAVLEDVIPLPRSAIREKDTVWIVEQDNRLRIQPVTIVRRELNTVLIDNGLSDGERVVLTPIPGAANGMKVRPLEQEMLQ